jgi:hypothetical protein
MYGSVEMLLKFYAENFHFRFTGQESREKPTPAHARFTFKLKISHWRLRYFTRTAPNDRIHSALVETSSTILKFSRNSFSALFGKVHETKTNYSLC